RLVGGSLMETARHQRETGQICPLRLFLAKGVLSFGHCRQRSTRFLSALIGCQTPSLPDRQPLRAPASISILHDVRTCAAWLHSDAKTDQLVVPMHNVSRCGI